MTRRKRRPSRAAPDLTMKRKSINEAAEKRRSLVISRKTSTGDLQAAIAAAGADMANESAAA
eukprot:CAMPEP_0198346264 /NCGR_PEP_ID=MMETSP1450-20131203/78603_1 /TAXON_ID=753684 ORGANISM="Madagascaria erythrocladiodes, Strain CCMP3234" /NCGR_SAMPLE_ID=MMETSP1450 /ASSEMBLY_ACC=CAM_ASM_001115 /LENGTH=61 /DNA_ID=CAMNT_0044051677 /DNA_START=24 /DNA_END=206 /DNA_ORIENTATION=+